MLCEPSLLVIRYEGPPQPDKNTAATIVKRTTLEKFIACILFIFFFILAIYFTPKNAFCQGVVKQFEIGLFYASKQCFTPHHNFFLFSKKLSYL
jgi:hypothetical protein